MIRCKRRVQALHIHVGHPHLLGDLHRGPSDEAIGVDPDDEAWLKADIVSPHETPSWHALGLPHVVHLVPGVLSR